MNKLLFQLDHIMATSSFVDRLLLVVGTGLVVFFVSFQLFESPETWMDEGLIMQSAIGVLATGKAALPVAPGIFEPAWYITTGFPVTLPLAGLFALFGVSLEVARLMMAAWLFVFFGAVFVYTRRAMHKSIAWLSFFFLIFFAPLYGNGRNVLGEVPGIVCMVLALLPLVRGGGLTRTRAVWVGVWAGLAVATKPIFVLFLPALLLVLILHRRELNLRRVYVFGGLGVLVPLVLWAVLQFGHTPLSNIFSLYANPHSVDLSTALFSNSKRLITELQPLYFLAALATWVVSYIVRRVRRETVFAAEEVLLFFSVLIFFAYLRTAGYYRYFFPAQVLALLYLPQSIWYLARKGNKVLFAVAGVVLLCMLAFQAHVTFFRSWVAVHYSATRTGELESYFETLPHTQEVFVYQAPEIVPFAYAHAVSQYVLVTPTVIVGERYRPQVLSGTASLVLVPGELYLREATTTFQHYRVSQQIDTYSVLTTERPAVPMR